MRTFRNNHKRGRYRNNDRNFKRNGENLKFNSDFSSDSFSILLKRFFFVDETKIDCMMSILL